MTFLKKLLGLNSSQPVNRVRICPECGMAVAEHKDWCSILRARQAMERREQAQKTA
jgi:ribosomal protein S27AE